jgi:hypothetical protein
MIYLLINSNGRPALMRQSFLGSLPRIYYIVCLYLHILMANKHDDDDDDVCHCLQGIMENSINTGWVSIKLVTYWPKCVPFDLNTFLDWKK